MKKADKIKLAEKCFNTIKQLKLTAEVQGYWIKLSPPKEIPKDLLVDLHSCSTELAELLRNDSSKKL